MAQTNKLNNYLILSNLVCEFVCGFCGHTKKERKKKTYRPVYRVALQLKIPSERKSVIMM